MEFLLQILVELITGFIPWRREQGSVVGESRLDRDAKRFGQVVLVLVMLILLGLLAWFCSRTKDSNRPPRVACIPAHSPSSGNFPPAKALMPSPVPLA